MCATDGRNDMSKFSEANWLGSFPVNNERRFLLNKKCFEGIPKRPEVACKFADWFSSVFHSPQMHFCVFCNLADSSSVKNKSGNHDIHGQKQKPHTCSYLGTGISENPKESKAI